VRQPNETQAVYVGKYHDCHATLGRIIVGVSIALGIFAGLLLLSMLPGWRP
jgi:hypothetical protein